MKTNALKYDLEDLRVFATVASLGNLTHAARVVNLAPSSASHRIQNLEAAIGTPLLERLPRGVRATAAGEALLRHARRVFAQLEQLHADLSPYALGIRSHIRLWANTHATHTYLPDDLAQFLKQHEQVRVSLEEHPSADILRAVAQGDVDIGIVAGMPESPNVIQLPYREDHLVLVVARQHPLARRKRIRFESVLEYPFVLLNSGSAIHTFTMNAAAALGAHLDVRIQVRSFEAVIRMVSAGAGVGLLPNSALSEQDLTHRVVALKLDEAWAPRHLKICIRADRELNKSTAALVLALSQGALDDAV